MVFKRLFVYLSISFSILSASFVEAQSNRDLSPSAKITTVKQKNKTKIEKAGKKCSGSCKGFSTAQRNAARRRAPTPTPRVRTPNPVPTCIPPQVPVCEGGRCGCHGGVSTPITIGPSSCPSGYRLECSRTPGNGTTYCACIPNQLPTPVPTPQTPSPVPQQPNPVCKSGERIICDGRTPCRCESIFPDPSPTPLQCKTGERKICDGLTPCRCESVFPTPSPMPLQCKTGERKICNGLSQCRCESIFPTPSPTPLKCNAAERVVCNGSSPCRCESVYPIPEQNTCTNSAQDGEYFLDLARTFSTRSLSCTRTALPLFSDQTRDVIPVVGRWSSKQVHSIGFFANNTQNGLWNIDSNGDGVIETGLPFGIATDIPIVGDWNNDGKDDFGTVRREEWFLDIDGSRSWTPAVDRGIIPFPGHCGVPLSGDINGDGLTDLALFKDGTWLIKYNQGGLRFSEISLAHFGQAGDFPVIADLDGDGRQELMVKRVSSWYVDSNSNLSWDGADATYLNFGEAIDVPIVGAWNATSIQASLGVYRSIYGLSGIPRTSCLGR